MTVAETLQRASARLQVDDVSEAERLCQELLAADGAQPDTPSALSTRLFTGFEHFVNVRGNSDREVAQWLRSQEIDIAVDLKGYTYDARLGILAPRPAPVQVTHLGREACGGCWR